MHEISPQLDAFKQLSYLPQNVMYSNTWSSIDYKDPTIIEHPPILNFDTIIQNMQLQKVNSNPIILKTEKSIKLDCCCGTNCLIF